MSLEDHSRLIRDAARTALSPLGFRQKGRSRVWFADRGFWLLIVEFQPSGFSKGSYLNIAAMWLWHPRNGWAFNHFQRASRFNAFETIEQFKPKAERLANLAAAEAMALDKKFESLAAIAHYLKEQASDERIGKNPWVLYHAAIAAGLTGDPAFSQEYFGALIAQKPTVGWMREMQAEAAALANLRIDSGEFYAAIRKKVAGTRTALKLQPLDDTL
jgi:hypothetical protein